MLIVGGEVGGRSGVDVRIAGAVIVEVGVGLERRAGEAVVDARGGAVLPGLHDHHVHLRALAAARRSVHVGPPQVTDPAAFEGRLRAAASATPPGGWVRAIGYHDTVAGPLDRHRLDAVVADRPVRVQHRSGALWVLNTQALRAVGLAAPDLPSPTPDGAGMAGEDVRGVERDGRGVPTGRLWRLDRWLADRVPPSPLDLAAVGRTAAERGVTGFTDADPVRSQADVDLLAAAGLPQRLMLMSATGLDLGPRPGAPSPGEPGPSAQRHGGPGPGSGGSAGRCGGSGDGGPRCTAGPRKLLLDDATLPPVDELAAWMAAAHADGEPVAVHCVTRLQLVAAATALAEARPAPGDRIEHGAVVPLELHGELRRLGVTVVTQPNFVAERGDQYRAEVAADDLPLLYPCASLRAAGIPVAAGTDAPFGDTDPWAALRAAVQRRTPSGAVLGPGERVDPATAMGLFLGRPDDPAAGRRVEPAAPADLCVLDRPLGALHAALATGDDALDPVVLTLVAGEVVADRR